MKVAGLDQILADAELFWAEQLLGPMTGITVNRVSNDNTGTRFWILADDLNGAFYSVIVTVNRKGITEVDSYIQVLTPPCPTCQQRQHLVRAARDFNKNFTYRLSYMEGDDFSRPLQYAVGAD